MLLVYLAGPFRDHYTGPDSRYNFWQQDQNCNDAAKVALKLWNEGFSVICPHLNTRPFQGALSDQIWLKGDMEQIRRSDALVVMPNWQYSHGTMAEIDFATDHKIPIFFWDEDLQDGFCMPGDRESLMEWK